jgi:tetrahydromethanopterin S-methyltransferase subunit A
LAGYGPPEPKGIVAEVKKVLVDKEKIMTSSDLKTLEKAVKYFKNYEYGKLNEISGNEIDEFKKEGDEYIKKMKEFRGKIELRMREHTAERVHDEVFSLLKQIFGSKGQEALIEDFNKELVEKGKVQVRMLNIAKEIADVKKRAKSAKLSQADMQKISGEGSELIGALIEYVQRKDLIALEKGVLQVSYSGGKKKAEVVLTDSGDFVVGEKGVRKISKGKLVESDRKELEKALADTKDRLKGKMDSKVLEVLKKEFGEFEISF